MRAFLTILVFVIGFTSSQAQHTDIFPNVTGSDLYQALVSDYKPSFVLTYDEARDTLFGSIDRVGDSLECIYSGHRIYLPQNQDPSSAAYMNGSNDGINTEHTYPQSLWSGGNSPKSDMHHLFPTRSIVNNSRASDPFADINDNFTDTWYYRNMSTSSAPNASVRDLYAEDTNSFFEPRESRKGDVARAMFYFYTMYRNEANAINANFFQSQASTLCQCNPYVLDCTLASRIDYCSGISEACMTVPNENIRDLSNNITISPNPTQNIVTINVENQLADTEIQIFDTSGKRLYQNTFQSGKHDVDVANFPNGMLFLQFRNDTSTSTKRLVKF